MTRKEKIKEVAEIDNEIAAIKKFNEILELEDTMNENFKYSFAFMKRETNVCFLGKITSGTNIEIRVPKYLRIEISSMCDKWIEELERRANELIP